MREGMERLTMNIVLQIHFQALSFHGLPRLNISRIEVKITTPLQ